MLRAIAAVLLALSLAACNEVSEVLPKTLQAPLAVDETVTGRSGWGVWA